MLLQLQQRLQSTPAPSTRNELICSTSDCVGRSLLTSTTVVALHARLFGRSAGRSELVYTPKLSASTPMESAQYKDQISRAIQHICENMSTTQHEQSVMHLQRSPTYVHDAQLEVQLRYERLPVTAYLHRGLRLPIYNGEQDYDASGGDGREGGDITTLDVDNSNYVDHRLRYKSDTKGVSPTPARSRHRRSISQGGGSAERLGPLHKLSFNAFAVPKDPPILHASSKVDTATT